MCDVDKYEQSTHEKASAFATQLAHRLAESRELEKEPASTQRLCLDFVDRVFACIEWTRRATHVVVGLLPGYPDTAAAHIAQSRLEYAAEHLHQAVRTEYEPIQQRKRALAALALVQYVLESLQNSVASLLRDFELSAADRPSRVRA
jgi:hypothetical protein